MAEYTKSDLLGEIENTWPALNEALDQLSDEQMTGPKDAEGWAVKDHLSHMAAWERSMVYLLQGKPRHEGLGVPEDLYLNASEDEFNAAIQRKCNDQTAAEALTDLRDVHSQLMGLLEKMSDEDLRKPYRHFLPNEPGKADDAPILNRVHGNSAWHFREHLGWIQSLVNGAS
ncbi:MAG TPA: DinB family protein [Chloroflexia bacterium]|nr:DinB family protein [Chloroflexia bacterium]